MTSLADGSAPRILIVDDEQPVCEAVGAYLAAYGLEADGAQELEEAEALLATTAYSLLIVDVHLTGLHGREGLELLTFARQRRPGIGVIVMTAHASADLEREARRRGAHGFVGKPILLSDLLYDVRRVLELVAAPSGRHHADA